MNSCRNEAALAEALDRALDRRRAPGDANGLDRDVAELVEVAHALEYAASAVVPGVEFREAARQRLLAKMARSSRTTTSVRSWVTHRIHAWILRLGCVVGRHAGRNSVITCTSRSQVRPRHRDQPFVSADSALIARHPPGRNHPKIAFLYGPAKRLRQLLRVIH
jgi:hypothetical protein